MLPIVEVPESIQRGMQAYREVFCRDQGFEHVCRYVTGLIVSPNKTLQGIYDLQVWEGQKPSRRAMHAGVFEAGWDDESLMKQHRQSMAKEHRGRGAEVISLDWTYAHHERGPHIFGTTRSYDYVQHCMSRYQTLVTAVISNQQSVDGLEVRVQEPNLLKAEEAYMKATSQENYESMEALTRRLTELLHYGMHAQQEPKRYKKRTQIAVDIVRQVEEENHFPQAHYAFDSGVLTKPLADLIEKHGKHWVSEIATNRNVQWHGEWKRVDWVDVQLRQTSAESFRRVRVSCRNGEIKDYWAFTKVVRVRKLGKKRLLIVHEQADLQDEPRFFLSSALHWESKRVIQTWSYRWGSEIFHELSKQVTGLESSQVRKEEGVKRHFRLSCVAHSLLQRVSSVSNCERYSFADGKTTVGQRVRGVAREVLHALLRRAQHLFEQGRSCQQVLDVLMPA